MADSTLGCAVLRACDDRLTEATRRASALGSLSHEQANWKPTADRWSVAECLEHISVSIENYLPGLEAAIQRGREKGWLGSAPFGRGPLIGRFLLKVVHPDHPGRAKAPTAFRPTLGSHSLADAGERLTRAAAELRRLLIAADGLDLGRLKMASPVTRLIRLSVAQAFEVQTFHTLRHLDQAERLTKTEGFPD